MATAPPNPPRKQNASLPPKRGRVKAQIFESLAGNLSSVASRAGQVLARIRGGSSAAPAGDTSTTTSASASASVTTSTSTSPPPCAYTSDGYPDQA